MNQEQIAPENTANRFTAVHNLGVLQQVAGVDPEMADLVTAYARLVTNAGRPLKFYNENATREDHRRQFIHRRFIRNNPDLDPRVLDFMLNYGNIMAARRLPIVYNVKHLAAKRRISEHRLRWMAWNQRAFYKEFRIAKANGDYRTILAPQGQLLTQQKWILRKILDRGKPHKYAYGFVKRRSVLDNAKPHADKKVVVRIDLKDFFPTITHQQVRKVFEQFGYPYRVSVLLANLCTVDGTLPQGAPTSPALSNLVAAKVDRRFAGLKKKLKFRYSRYADDLVFSSNNPRLPCLIPFFKDVLREEGFTVNERKTQVMRQGQQQKVTGVVVNRKPNLARAQRRLLRAALHRLQTKGPEAVALKSRNPDADPVYVLRGHLGYLGMLTGVKAGMGIG